MPDKLKEMIIERDELLLKNEVLESKYKNVASAFVELVDDVANRDDKLDKIDRHELKTFVESNGKMVTNEFKVSMKKLHDALK